MFSMTAENFDSHLAVPCQRAGNHLQERVWF
jgi:hypothetical protein